MVDYYYFFFNYGSNFIMIVCGLVFDRKYLFEVVKQTNHWCLGPLLGEWVYNGADLIKESLNH